MKTTLMAAAALVLALTTPPANGLPKPGPAPAPSRVDLPTITQYPAVFHPELKELFDLDALKTTFLADFDQELDTNPEFQLTSSEAYLNLQAIREQREESIERLEAISTSSDRLYSGADFDRIEWNHAALVSRGLELKAAPLVVAKIQQTRSEFQLIPVRGGQYQSAQFIEPSVQSNGSINGSEFPAGTWAMTIDDGPLRHDKKGPVTESITQTLNSYQISATFFWLARQVLTFPDIVNWVNGFGHSLQTHSYTHKNLSRAADKTLSEEVDLATEVESQAYGKRPRFFRLPYGAGINSRRTRAAIARAGLIHVSWNVDSNDWADHNPASSSQRVLRQMSVAARQGTGGVILYHDIQQFTPDSIRILLSQLSRSSLRWVTIPQIVDELNRGR